MWISALFPALPNLSFWKSKKSKKLFTVFRQGSWTKLYERVFLWTKGKDSIQYLTQNLTQFTWNTLLYCLCKSKARSKPAVIARLGFIDFAELGFVDFV